MGDGQVRAHRLDREVHRALELAGRRRHDRLVVGRSRSAIHRGPSGVSSPAFSARSRSLSGASCRQAPGQASGARPPASAARSVPWWGEPRVTTRRTTDAAAGSSHPQAGHHPAGRVADHVDGVGALPRPWPGRRPRPGGAPAPAGRRCRRRAGRRSLTSRPSSRSAAASTSSASVPPPYPGTSSTGPGSSWAAGTTRASRPDRPGSHRHSDREQHEPTTPSTKRRRAGARSRSTSRSWHARLSRRREKLAQCRSAPMPPSAGQCRTSRRVVKPSGVRAVMSSSHSWRAIHRPSPSSGNGSSPVRT